MSTEAADARVTTAPLDRRWFLGAAVVAVVLAFAQVPGRVVADTKYDLAQNPLGFLGRAWHQWSGLSPLGQVQNQAYGYFFPHGPFFALGDLLHVPAWVTQRVWWAILLLAGFWGLVRLAEALGIGSRGSRVFAAVVFALSPRVLTTLGSISSETLPMMVAPWVLVPIVRYLHPRDGQPALSARGAAARSAIAVALMGSVNAVATAAACLVAVLFWAAHRPGIRWWRLTAWWLPCCVVACVWWIVPLLLLGSVSPPFLDYIESSRVTTEWASLTEILRGTDSWTPFVSPERIAGAVLVTQPAAVLVTGVLAAAGLAGLAMRSMPARGRLTLILFVGLVGLGAGYVGELGSPVAESVRAFLDGAGAPLRNVHKLEPLIRIPLVLGLAHLIGRVPLPGSAPWRRVRSAFAHPERDPMVAVTTALLVAAVLATSLAWTGRLAPRGAYDAVPDHWSQAAHWLEDHTSDRGERALVVPGAPFGSQIWGLTRDEPLQALASTPWTSRDAVPLVPRGASRALDSVQRLFADGRGSPALAATLRSQGIGFVVVRNDLDPDTSRSARPLLVHRTLDASPGFERAATFGDDIETATAADFVVDADLRPSYPAVEIFRVAPAPAGPYVVDAADVPAVVGGPEALLGVRESRARRDGAADAGPMLLDADARAAGLEPGPVLVTDTPTDRETDYGEVDHHNSAVRAEGDPRRTHNAVPDYPVVDARGEPTPLVRAEWSGARISVSSAASDASQLGGTQPGAGPAAVVDGDPSTGWHSNGLESAVGQWMQLDLDRPITAGMLRVATSAGAIGSPVKWLEVTTDRGSTAVRVTEPGAAQTVALPLGTTTWIRITATRTENGTRGNQFGIADLSLDDYSDPDRPSTVPIESRLRLPDLDTGTTVRGWDLRQEFPGRGNCVDTTDRVRCALGLGIGAEEPRLFRRSLSVPADTTVVPDLGLRPRPGPALDALLAQPDRVRAAGDAAVRDPQGSAWAAVDGDPRTSWTAPESSAEPDAAHPTLTLHLPAPTLVTGLTIAPSRGATPVPPTRVTVNLGAGPQVREVDPDGTTTVELTPHVTDTVELEVTAWQPTLDRTVLGFDKPAPPGIAEVGVRGPDGLVAASTGTVADRPVTIGCDAGPVVTVDGRPHAMSITTTVGALAAGDTVRATPCEGDPIPLDAGRSAVDVDPTPAFTVLAASLSVSGVDGGATVPGAPATEVPIEAWGDDVRSVRLDARPDDAGDRVLVVPESTNPGWRARAEDGTVLSPLVVDGWQQGWIVPAGVSGTITLDYRTDLAYRIGIGGGLALVVLLPLLVWFDRRRPRRDDAPPAVVYRPGTVGVVGVAVAATLVTGPVGAIVTAVGVAALVALRRRRGANAAARATVGVASGAMLAATALLSTGPWRADGGYVGHAWQVQWCASVAVVAVGLAASGVAERRSGRDSRSPDDPEARAVA